LQKEKEGQKKMDQEEAERRRKYEEQQAQMEHENGAMLDDADIDSLFKDDGEETPETVSTCNETGTPDLFGGNRGGYMRVLDDADEL
jgi:hypothetical protein